jgi:ribosomal protein L29
VVTNNEPTGREQSEMNRDELNKLVNKTWERLHHLRNTKGVEYAGNEDVLKNFKRGAELAGLTPLQVAMIFASKHYDSISTYVRGHALFAMHMTENPPRMSESIEGRLDDLINYMLLIQGLIAEDQEATAAARVHTMFTEEELNNGH